MVPIYVFSHLLCFFAFNGSVLRVHCVYVVTYLVLYDYLLSSVCSSGLEAATHCGLPSDYQLL